MTCSFDVRLPLAKVFCAKLMTVLAAAAPGACIKLTLMSSMQCHLLMRRQEAILLITELKTLQVHVQRQQKSRCLRKALP